MQHKVSAPGSLMLLGEHAVLHGKQALVCAIDKRLTVTLTPRDDKHIRITSKLGQYSAKLSEIKMEKPFQFVLGALQVFMESNGLSQGYDIHIKSEFSDQMGFGSSAAVTVATLSALASSCEIDFTALELVRLGRDVVRRVQGVGSGADIAASVYGGVVRYHADPVQVEKIPVMLPLHAVYSGYKTPTADVVNQVQKRYATQQNLFATICNDIHRCSFVGGQYLRDENWAELGNIMNMQQDAMEVMGVSSPFLREIIQDLRDQAGIYGAKISGSGLGDCIIALGRLPIDYECVVHGKILPRIAIDMSLRGLECEKI